MTKLMYDVFILEYHPDHPRAEGDGWVPQQILVMEEHLGRQLTPDEEVRHLSKNLHDNSIKNLKIYSAYTQKPTSIFDSQDNHKLSKTFIACKYQRECWKTVREPIAKANKIFLPYICDYQVSGDIYKCSHFWRFKKRDEEEGITNDL